MDSGETPPAGDLADSHVAEKLDRILAQLDRLALRQEQLSPAPTPAAPRLLSKIYRPKHLSVRAMQALAAPLLTEGVGRIGASLPQDAAGTASDDEPPAPTDAVVVRDTAEVLRKIDRLLQELDVPPPQVLIEATVLAVRVDADHPFGVNLADFRAGDAGFSLDPAGDASPALAPNGAPGAGGAAARLTHGAGAKCAVVRGSVQSFVQALRKALSVEGVSAWQATVVNKRPAEFVIAERSIVPAHVRGSAGGAVLVVRPLTTRSGSIQLDVRMQVATPEGSAAQATWTNARSHQFVLRGGQTAAFSGFLREGAASAESTGAAAAPSGRTEVIVLLTPHLLNTAGTDGTQTRTAARSRSSSKEGSAGSRPAAPTKRSARPPATRTTSLPSGKTARPPARLAAHVVQKAATIDSSIGSIPELVLPEAKPVRPQPAIRPGRIDGP
jgi:type II secretory pathway component GspD/PulD (secretin)